MIPTVLIPSLLIGRWWFVAVGAALWPALVGFGGDCAGSCLISAMFLGALNAAFGVAIHQLVRAGWSRRH